MKFKGSKADLASYWKGQATELREQGRTHYTERSVFRKVKMAEAARLEACAMMLLNLEEPR